MKLNEFFDHLDVTEAPKKFPEGHYTHTPGALAVMPTQDQTLWADAGELPKKFNVTKMKIAIYDEGDDQDPYSYGNGGLLVYHNAGTWKMYTDDVTRVQIADYLGIPTKDIDFSEQGMQDEGFMHFDIEDDAVAQLISKGAFKLEETTTEDNVDDVYPGTGDIYGYTWNCKKCGTENEFSMSRQDAQEYIDEWEADNEDLVADGESGSSALIDALAQGEDSGFHIGNKCVKCGTEVKDYPYSESINDIIRLSGLK